MPRVTPIQIRARLEAAYKNAIAQAARDRALLIEKPQFDPQGRILIELSRDDCLEIIKANVTPAGRTAQHAINVECAQLQTEISELEQQYEGLDAAEQQQERGLLLRQAINDLKKRKNDLEQFNTLIAQYIQAPNPEKLDALIGKRTPKTTVSLDVLHTADLVSLKNQFSDKLRTALLHADEKRSSLFRSLYPRPADSIVSEVLDIKQPKGSFISLQQEFHFHLGLVGRVYQQIDPRGKGITDEQMQAIHQAAMSEVNELVMKAYAEALIDASDFFGKIDIKKLNKAMDKARAKIMPKAHDIFTEELARQTGIVFTGEELRDADLKHKAEATTATANDLLHLDPQQRLATLIEGSNATAHHREAGTVFAHRSMTTSGLSADGTQITPSRAPRIQIRTPSPVVKVDIEDSENYNELNQRTRATLGAKAPEKEVRDFCYIIDASNKIKSIAEEYELHTQLAQQPGMPRAFIYNSHTAINDTIGDDSLAFWKKARNKNFQTESAVNILYGAHIANASELITHPTSPVFCFVQNISVNGGGDTLGYGSGDQILEESTLMAEMAMMHTLYPDAGDQTATIQEVMTLYKNYLDKKEEKGFFCDSTEGKAAKILIQEIKNNWKNSPPQDLSTDFLKNARLALRNLMANNGHMTHKYAKLIQSLSVFVEEASISGCKSGNERAQAINGRVAVFDKVLETGEPSEVREAIEALAKENYAARKGEGFFAWLKRPIEYFTYNSSTAQSLKRAVDKEFNDNSLQGAAALTSLMDQGAAAKVAAAIKLVLKTLLPHNLWKYLTSKLNRNYGEEAEMGNLSQSKSSAMQAHKGLPEEMERACGKPKSLWSSLKSNPLGAVGGALLIFPFFIFGIGVGLYNLYENSKRKERFDKLESIAAKTGFRQPAVGRLSPEVEEDLEASLSRQNSSLAGLSQPLLHHQQASDEEERPYSPPSKYTPPPIGPQQHVDAGAGVGGTLTTAELKRQMSLMHTAESQRTLEQPANGVQSLTG
jgi:hypothetical protein